MPRVVIEWDAEKLYSELLDMGRDQVPFALSQTINNAAKYFQRSEQAMIAENFVLRRRQWVLRGIYIGRFCTKRDEPMEVTIEVQPSRDILDKFEDGGTKVPRSGSNLAVPILGHSAKPSVTSIVPSELRPRQLGFVDSTTKSGKTQTKGEQRTFIITLPNGRQAIMRRNGPASEDVEMLFAFTPSAQIPAILHFGETAEGTIPEAMEKDFPLFFEQAMRTRQP